MTINLADNSPRISYAVAQGATQTSFAVPFEFFASADLNVYVDGTLKSLTTHYTVSGGDGSTGTVTISVTGATGGSTVVITRDVALERTTDFPSSGPFQIGALNTELDRLTAIAADLDDKAGRALQLTDFDVAASLVLPTVDNRKGKTLAFNASSGAVEAGPTISDVQTVSAAAADIQTLAHIEDGTDATDAIQTVAGISSNVTTVAGVSSAVSTVAGISSNVTAVAGDATDIGAVAGKATEIGRLGTSDAVADLAILGTSDAVSDMNTLAAISSNISTVAGISANVTSVAGVASLITSDFVADLNTLATSDIVSDLNTLATADIVSDLNTLATTDIVSDLNTLATADIVSDLNTLATTDIVSDLNTLATTDIVTDLNLLATSAIVEDLNLLATSTVIADMATLAGAGANPNISSLGVSGNITLGDNNKIIMGAGSDLQLYHDGTNSFVQDAAAGDLILDTNGDSVRITNTSNGETMARFQKNNKVELYYDNAISLTTTSTGIQVTGNIANASGDLTIDVAGEINLDTDGAVVNFKDGGTTFGLVTQSSNDFVIRNPTSDKDLLFKGNDGGSTITALTLDMSQAGRATFNEGIVLKSSTGGDFGVNINTASGDSMKLQVVDTGSAGAANGVITVTDGDLILSPSANVGINDSSPDGKLNVVSTAHNNGSIFDSTGTTQLWLRDTDASSNQKNWGFQVSGGSLNILRANDDRASGFVTPIEIQQAPANSLVINSSGHAIITAGVTIGGTGAANHLDDYEEGTWTPVSDYGTLTSVTATYTKIGNSVFIRLNCTMPSTSSSSIMAFSGLPFSTAQDGSAQIGYTGSANYNPAILIQGTTCYFYGGSGGAIAASTYSGAIVRFTGQYNTTA